MVFVLLVGLVVIWVHELQAFAVFFLALVFATYELIGQRESRPGVWALYPTHVILLRDKDAWRDAERHLRAAAKAERASFTEAAGRQMKLLEQITNSKLCLRIIGSRFNYPKPSTCIWF